ncbi:uncharacterized protein LOC143183143 [Calliopsis andreniformis]|uniref:uncharacterized protein LOC143183143 n=1 Tax=Calliopsis andreniformis TaxID=337506 RepID=UPI003FCCF913
MMDDDSRTIWCGNLSEKVTEEILYELFLQGGPVQRVSIPKDRDGRQRTFGFVTYKHINSVSYALSLFDGTTLFNRPIQISTRNNAELPQITNTQDHSLNFNHMLQLGQQMLITNEGPHLKLDIFGMHMLPQVNTHSNQIDNHSHKDDKRSRRMHPYEREHSKHNSYSKDHKSRSSRDNYKSHNYFRRDHRSNRHNYR